MRLQSMVETAVGRVWRGLVEVCFPPCCAACGRFDEASHPLCGACEGLLEAAEQKPACAVCGKPLAVAGPCPWCAEERSWPFQQTVQLGVYDEPLRALIHQMKYRRRWWVGEMMAERLWEKPAVRAVVEEAECIVPVPLHWFRQIGRGYNQAEVIARVLGKRAGRPVVCALRRVRDTESQTGLHSRQAREANVRGAFVLKRAGPVAGRRILLVDDVMTSGATLRSAAKAIREAKTAQLSALVVAVADPRGRDFTRI